MKVFTSSKEQRLKRRQLLTKIAKLNKEWRVSFEVKPTICKTQQCSVFHMTVGGRGARPGHQTPAVWFHKTEGILVAGYVNGNYSFMQTFKGLPERGEWIRIEISQVKAGSQYVYSIAINGEERFSEENTRAEQFSNVHVYASSPFSQGQKGSIRNVTVENKEDGKI